MDEINSKVLRSLNVPFREVPALQGDQGDPVVRKWRAWDPKGLQLGLDGRADVRLFLDVQSLQRLLDIARSGPVLRVAIHGLQIELEERRSKDGHHYIVAVFDGLPVAELSGAESTVLARHGQ